MLSDIHSSYLIKYIEAIKRFGVQVSNLWNVT